MSKKITSTVLLFAVFVGFLWWGVSKLATDLSAQAKDGEEIVYSFLILGCSLVALIALLRLPRKNQS
jgi:hypothetical protein